MSLVECEGNENFTEMSLMSPTREGNEYFAKMSWMSATREGNENFAEMCEGNEYFAVCAGNEYFAVKPICEGNEYFAEAFGEGNEYFSLARGCKYTTSGLHCKGNMRSRIDKRGSSADTSGSEEIFGHKFFVKGNVNFSYDTARCPRRFHKFPWLAVVLQYCTAEYLGLCSVLTWVLMSLTSHLSQGACRLAEHRICRWFKRSLSSVASGPCKLVQRQKQTASRVCKRRVRQAVLTQRMQLKALLFCSWICHGKCMDSPQSAQGVGSAIGASENEFLERLLQMTNAATSAARAAEQAVQRMSGGSSRSDALQAGLTTASRILKNPETYSGDDPMSFSAWKFQFVSWLTFGEQKFQKILEDLEKSKDDPDPDLFTDEETQLSSRLFSILTSYLKGKCLNLVRSRMGQRNGFQLWRDLHREFLPNTRQRSLTLAQTLAAYPCFSSSKSYLENILEYEQLVSDYELVSGSSYPAELKAATLLRCSEQRVREHLQLTISDSTTYQEIREALLSYEKVSKVWTPESVLKSLQTSQSSLAKQLASPSIDTGGPQPMEVDRIESKGKGYDKGKGKYGKGRGWWNAFSFDSFRGRGRGQASAHKGKGKSKGKKGKGKSKGKQPSKGKGKVDPQQCRICLEYGHWSNECPRRVNQVQQSEAQHLQSAQVPSSAHVPLQTAAAAGSAVRRIFNIGRSPVASSLPASSASHVRVIFEELDADTVNRDRRLVILDSGSDVSLLPLCFGLTLQPGQESDASLCLRDCQGRHLETQGSREASLVTRSSEGEEIELKHTFIIGDVKSCILSLGELYQNGWSVIPGEKQPMLVSPGGAVQIPVVYQRNSFAIEASVERVELSHEESSNLLAVRAVVKVSEDFVFPERYGVWQLVKECPYSLRLGVGFVDPRPRWSANFPFRTTLIKRVMNAAVNEWCVCEVSTRYLDLEDPFGVIPEIATFGCEEQCVILTILSSEERGLSFFGTLLDEGGVAIEPEFGGGEGEFQEDKGVSEGLQLAPTLEEEEVSEKLVIGEELEITPYSPVNILRQAARFLHVSSSGSKQKIFRRIREAHVMSLKMKALEIAQQQYASMNPAPRFHDAPKQPSDKERREHEVTHLPMKPWCAACVRGKSKSNAHKPSGEEAALRTFPTIQVDFGGEESNQLLLVDTWTKYLHVEPLKVKNQATVGECISHFLATLGYFDKVELAFDNEPVLAAGARFARTIRANNGMETALQPSKLYDKGRTSVAERMIQLVRGQQKTLVCFVEEKLEAKFDVDHPIQTWALQHAVWLVNRFHVSSTTGCTAHMSLRGRPYRGRVCYFAETVYALDPLQSKYSSQWRRGVWLGKDEADHDIVAVGADEVIKSKAVRKTSEVWDASALVSLQICPWNVKRSSVHHQMRVSPNTPLPSLLPHLPVSYSSAPAQDAPDEPSNVVADPEAAAVEKYALEHPDEDADPVALAPATPSSPVPEMTPSQDLEAMSVDREESRSVKQRIAEYENKPKQAPKTAGEESLSKVARLDPETSIPERKSKSPRTGELHSPTFAGNLASASASTSRGSVRRVVEGIELYDEDELELIQTEGDLEWNEATGISDLSAASHAVLSPDEKAARGFLDEGLGPPSVSDTEKRGFEQEALITELQRLSDLSVIEEFSGDETEAVQLDTRVVYDWRFRNGIWTYRARMVAREFKTGGGSEDTFSPTNPIAVVKILLALAATLDLFISVFDVSDAFLQVEQKELVLILVPEWIKELLKRPNLRFWRLKRCLPGQRNAALRWFEYFSCLCEKAGYESFQGGPLFRHGTKQSFLSVHIDDIIQVSSKSECLQFRNEFSKILKLKAEGPFGRTEPGVVFYLKRKIEICEESIFISPNSKYVPKLVELLHLTERRPRTTPSAPELDVYDPHATLPEECLNAKQTSLFRSALGICIYVAQERFDIQHSVRVLSSYMSRPTKQALNAVKKLVSYLQYTQDMRMEFPRMSLRSSVFSRWIRIDQQISVPSMYNPPYLLEAFSDSDWATSKTSRKSTSSGVIFFCGCCIYSHSRSQTSIALSSMEAEVLAATGLLIETIYLKQVIQFLVKDVSGLPESNVVQTRLYLDSTSAQQFVQRLGPGRAKHLATRLLWSQLALRRGWFTIHRVSTRVNPADLNTKVLSKDRRCFLSRLLGFSSECLAHEPSATPMVRLVRMLMSLQLQ